jgi:two-component system response regulator HydG
VLVVEDDPPVHKMCLAIAQSMGFRTVSADCLRSARSALAMPIDVVLLDLNLPDGGNGFDLLGEIRLQHPSAVVVIMTAFASVDSAVEALRTGAGDFLPKPFTLEQLGATLERAAERRAFQPDARALRERLRDGSSPGQLAGSSPGMEKLFRILSKVAFTTHPVLILGEPGSGKNLVAQTIHRSGPRAGEPLHTIECRNAPAAEVEAQMFGSDAQPSLLAGGGTLFLEEVQELPTELQARLARTLEKRSVPCPDGEPRPLTVRLLASSSRDLAQMVEAGRFRKDLYYRLNVVNLRVPPLRERKEDIPVLARQILAELHGDNATTYALAQEATHLFVDYDWPGNVRELQHALERAVALSSGPVLHLGDLPTQLQNAQLERAHREAEEAPAAVSVQVQSIAEMERQAILATLRQVSGDKVRAARLLGIGKTTLYRKLKEYGVTEAEFG